MAAIRKERLSAARRGYGRAWQKARLVFLSDHRFCESHKSWGVLEPATVVDHIEPHRGDYDLFWDTGNWQALCAKCHNRKTGRETKLSRS